MKYHRFLHHEIEKYEGKGAESSLDKGALLKIQTRGVLRPKTDSYKRRRQSVENQCLEKV